MVDERHSAVDNQYLFNGKELDQETGLYYYGARYYDPKMAMWYGVDPLAEKYAFSSPYEYCVNNPVILVDPDGRKVITHGKEAQENIKYTLTKKEAKFVKFDSDGKIDVDKQNKSKSKSGNMKALKEVANKQRKYHVYVADSYPQDESPKELAKNDEFGIFGVTLTPGNKTTDKSPDEDVHIYTSTHMSKEKQVTNTAHELYGHASSYELYVSGEGGLYPFHVKKIRYEFNPKATKPEDMHQMLIEETNLKLRDYINLRVSEALKNFKSRKKSY